jgi:hypothetical protein
MSSITGKRRTKRVPELTRESLTKAISGTSAEGLDRMLDTPLYTFRVLKCLYEDGSLSVAGFLNNDDVYHLRIAGTGGKGELLIKDEILALFTRFNMAGGFAEKGDALTAFLLDNDDKFYEYFDDALNNKEEGADIDEEIYAGEFNLAYNRIGTILLNQNANDYMNNNEEIINHLTEK